ncbi:SDR family oxidoreductase [Aureivirga sp. CE67]|uniref:SDR family oxidoreductase n=1 Tax=Aureivirga sp. CE67 TaxID=1788983 RepID=UPI0018CBB4BC|nr:SDR family oxidoreductase [Aureivirga sp. CE67]
MNKAILITGCSSGIGRATAKYFQEKGWNVIATIRTNPEEDVELNSLENVFVSKMDVTKLETIEKTVKDGIDKFGKIDVLLNNAGYGSYGLLEASSEEKIRRQMEVNIIGPLMVIKELLPHFRQNKSGIIMNVSSMGGKITFPLGTLYHGSKFAVEGMSEALSYELDAIGVKVKLIEPGVINTNFATTSFDLNLDESLEEYQEFTTKILTAFGGLGSSSSEAELVAETIFKAAMDESDQMRYVVGNDAEQLIDARKKMDDSTYMNMMKSQFDL